MKLYFLFCLTLLIQDNLKAQCSIEQLSAPFVTTYPGGQSFVPCQSGEVYEVQFKLGATTASSADFRLLDNSCTVLWSISNVPISSNSTIAIDLTSSGSGSTKNVIAGNTYHVQLLPSGGYAEFYYHSTSQYPDGGFESSLCISSPPDLWFRVGIDQYLSMLPVELIQFKGDILDESIILKWQTASELNNEIFEIEQSRNGLEFQKIGEVEGIGTSVEYQHYSFEVKSPTNGISYYRLKQTDLGGQYEYSNVIRLNFKAGVEEVGEFYPNPSRPLIANLNYSCAHDEIIVFFVYDIAGRLVANQIQEVSSGNNDLRLDLFGLNAGIYIVNIKNERNSTQRRLIIKN